MTPRPTPAEVINSTTVREQSHLQRLAIMLIFGGRYEIVTSLEEDDFTVGTYRKVFAAVQSHHRLFGNADPFSVHHSLAGKDWYEKLGGMTMLLEHFTPLEGSYASPAEAKRVVTMIKESRSMTALRSIEEDIKTFGNGDVATLLQFIKGKAKEAEDMLPKNVSMSVKDMADYLQDRVVQKVPTGYDRVDEVLNGGITNGAVFVIAARPGVGKTTLALNIAAKVAQSGKRVLFLSLEMSREDIAERFMCGYGGFTMAEVKKNAKSLFSKIEGDLLIDDSRRTLSAIQTAFMYNSHCDLFIIDYLQLMTIEGEETSRIQEVSKIVRDLKNMARDMDKPIILLSQLSRAIEKDRHNREPVLSDLKDSGTIEENSDYVTFLWNKAAKQGDNDAIDDDDFGIESPEADVRWIVRKNRYGPPNRSYKMAFDAPHYLFAHKDVGRPIEKERPRKAF